MEEKIKAIIAYSGLNDAAFSKKIGVQPMTLWRQLNGQRKVSLETVLSIINEFPEIDCNWLLRGTGTMLMDNTAQEKKIGNLIDVIAMQQETINNLKEKIKTLQTK